MIAAFLSIAGVLLLWWRWRELAVSKESLPMGMRPLVSIIVPARNEGAIIAKLLGSLADLDYPNYEIIVLNDCSEDDTAQVVEAMVDPRLRLINGKSKPDGWGGKHWACHQAAEQAHGEILLFTDADTVHAGDSLCRAVRALTANGGGMLSALPFHESKCWWERLIGPFHVILLTLTAPLSKPRVGRVYAIGQYLMFTRHAYWQLGGHAAVKSKMVEDLPLAQLCLQHGITYQVFSEGAPLFRVRMYDSLGAFVDGWRRNFRAGLGMTTPLATVEAAVLIGALTGGGDIFNSYVCLAASVAAIFLVARVQQRLGNFSALGAVLFPFSVAFFCLVTGLAVSDLLTRRPMRWKSRAYSQ